jgi:hypothetical protein
MKWTTRLKRAKIYAQYFPLTLNFFIIAVGFGAARYFLYRSDTEEQAFTASFRPLIMMMCKVAFWFIAALVTLSVLSTIICWAYYLWLKQKKNSHLKVTFSNDQSQRALVLSSVLEKAFRPFLGFIKARLVYDNDELTDRFLLAGNKKSKGKFWRDAVSGKSVLELPGIKEYSIKGGFVFFEDMLQLLSLPVRQTVSGHFYKSPELQKQTAQDAQPRKTDETEVRIEQMRRVDGDYFHYKDFEMGDDVRRIVWKLYAKNRELVVRTPEIFNPFASHIYFYASFYSTLNALQQENDFSAEMLSYYKQRVWTAFETLSKKEFEVKYIADQQLHLPEAENMIAQVQRTISCSAWHADISATDYFQPRYGAVICISSMNEVEDVRQLLDQCSADTVVYYVKLSNCFKSYAPLTWLMRLFIKPPNDRLKRLKSRWLFSTLRLPLLKREKKIEAILAQSEAIYGQL